MTDIHAGDAATLISDAPDRPVELLADPTSTEMVGQLPSTKVVVLALERNSPCRRRG
jgi:hypothetical protein